MKEVDELIERLNSAYTPESIFRRDVNSVIQRHAKEGQNWSILSSDIADGLTDLGYVKVVRCEECKHLEERTIAEFDKEHPCKTMYICKSPHSHMKGIARFDGDYYCSEGEPKEAE